MDLKALEEISSKIDHLTDKVMAEKESFETTGSIDLSSIESSFNEIFIKLDNQKITDEIKAKLEIFQKNFQILGDTLIKHRDVLSSDVQSITSHEKGLKAYTHNATLSGKNSR
ncbi:MAG: hypothetical protein ACTHJ4_01395 [Candidatus Nucleicultricaceae bacterium]